MDVERAKSVTIFDIAQASGVSYSTVSRVLNGFEHVRDATRQRVLEAADELGYVANVQARSLAGGRSQVVGVLVPSFDNAYISAVCQGIDEASTAAGYDLMLYTTHHKKGKEAKYAHAIANGLTDGLLLMVPLIDSGELDTTYLDVLRRRSFPYVLIDQTDPNAQSSVVDSTNHQGAYEATSYLLGLGHRRIGFITGKMALNAAKVRLEGYKAALRDHGVPLDDRLVAEGDFYYGAGSRAAETLLARDPVPTALFASNDLSALGAVDAARARGLNVPGDLSVIGFDDIPQASLTYPKLTTVRQPLEAMGRAAVEMLLAQLEDPGRAPEHRRLSTELVVRDSCRPLQTGDPP